MIKEDESFKIILVRSVFTAKNETFNFLCLAKADLRKTEKNV